MDGHGILSPRYLQTALETLERTGAANVGGVMRADGRTPPRAGETVWMVPKVEHVHLFDAASEALVALEHLVIDGEPRYFARSISNLFLLDPRAAARRMADWALA